MLSLRFETEVSVKFSLQFTLQTRTSH